jgi:cytosine/adenosine deaminase-related metal-dependent hydrolase
MTSKVLIKGGVVLSLGSETPNFKEADVLIEGGRIVEVGPSLRARDAEQLDAADSIVMPGFVDAHRHAWLSIFRNMGADDALLQQSVAIPDLATRLGPDDVYASTLIGLLGAIESGITTVVDWSDVLADESYIEATLQAHHEARMRTVLVQSNSQPRSGSAIDHLRSLIDRRGPAVEALMTVAFGESSLEAREVGAVGQDWIAVREAGLRVHAHAGIGADTPRSISEHTNSGLLGPDVTLIHCSHLGELDLDIVRDSGAQVVFTPASEMTRGLGSPPVQELIDRGLRPGLGVDNEIASPGDMFAQMRAAISIQHATLFESKLAGKAGVPQLLGTRDVIRWATDDSAKAIGLGSVVGRLDPGMQADVVVLRADQANIYPINDPIGAVVWGMDTSNVDSVFVAGRALLRDGNLVGDASRARALALEVSRRAAARPSGDSSADQVALS